MTEDELQAVLITGTVGSGKTAVAVEMGELLGELGQAAAVIDLDWLGWFHAAPGSDNPIDELIAENLAAILPNFRSRGIRHLLLSRAIQKPTQVEAIRHAAGDVHLVVVRLTASPGTVAARLHSRDSGAVLEEHLAESEEMARLQDEAGVEDFRVPNEDPPVRAVAAELLERLGWI